MWSGRVCVVFVASIRKIKRVKGGECSYGYLTCLSSYPKQMKEMREGGWVIQIRVMLNKA